MVKKEIRARFGDLVQVELNSGETMEGVYSYHNLAGYCILNKNGFPISYKRILKKL